MADSPVSPSSMPPTRMGADWFARADWDAIDALTKAPTIIPEPSPAAETPATFVRLGAPRDERLRIPVADLWFEPARDGAQLLAAVELAGTLTEFHVCLLGGVVVFRMVADIKGRRVFAASEWHPADDPGRPLPSRMSLPSGPFRRGPQDVA